MPKLKKQITFIPLAGGVKYGPIRITEKSMTLSELRKYKPQIMEMAARAGLSNIRVFGSLARGESHPKDIDFLVTLGPRIDWNFFSFQGEVESLLGYKVDVLPDNIKKPRLRENVEREAVQL